MILEARQPGRAWGLRNRFTDLNHQVRNGKKTIVEAIKEAASAMDAWNRIHPDVEFKLTVLQHGEEHPYKRKDTKWRQPTAEDLAGITASRPANNRGRDRPADGTDKRTDADEPSGAGADDRGAVDLSGHDAFAEPHGRRSPQGRVARGSGLY